MHQGSELVAISEMQRRLVAATTPSRKRAVESDAQRLRDLYVLANKVDEANEYAEVAIEAARQLGELLDPNVSERQRTDLTVQGAEQFDIPRATKSEYRNLARKTAEDVSAYKAACLEAGDVMSKRGLLKYRVETGFQPANYSSASVEWYTPQRYTDAVHEALGGIDLDPASSDTANESIGAAEIFTVDDDGLEQDWRGRVFVNPPYGVTADGLSMAGAFCEKAIAEYEQGNIESCVILVNSSHSQNWQAVLYEYPVCFVDHRIKFVSGDGEANDNPTFQNIFVYLGPDKRAFARAFAQYGYVMERVKT